MKLRTFTAKDMPAAMKQIKKALGPDAVILASQKEPGRQSVRVTAAIDADSKQTAFEDFKDTIEFAKRRNQQREWLDQLTQLLEFHRVPEQTIRRIKRLSEHIDLGAMLTLQKISPSSSRSIITEKLLETVLGHCFSFSPVNASEAGKRICFVGPMGAGKTIATAKFATLLAMKKKGVSVITLDNERAGAIEQLSKYTDILKLDLHVTSNKQELLRIIKSIPLSHTTLIDTPGLSPTDQAAIDQLLTTIDSGGIEPMLVMPAGLDSEESIDVAHAFSHPTIKRMLATRMDATRRYGNIITAASESGLALSHLSNSPQVAHSCTGLNETILASFLLQHTKPLSSQKTNTPTVKEVYHEHSG